jgi:hypothetical protein
MIGFRHSDPSKVSEGSKVSERETPIFVGSPTLPILPIPLEANFFLKQQKTCDVHLNVCANDDFVYINRLISIGSIGSIGKPTNPSVFLSDTFDDSVGQSTGSIGTPARPHPWVAQLFPRIYKKGSRRHAC